MARVLIEAHKDAATVSRVTAETEKILDQIRQRAHNLFQQRGAADGASAEDWLQAEREMIAVPPSELVETNERYVLRAAIPGLTPDKVRVRVTPRFVVIQGEEKQPDHAEGDRVHFNEWNLNPAFRRFAMPAEIDIDRVKGSLVNGILRIEAPKKKRRVQARQGKKQNSTPPSPASKKKAVRKRAPKSSSPRRGT